MKYGAIHQAGNGAVSGAGAMRARTIPQPRDIAINSIAPIFYARIINDYSAFA